MKSFTKKLIIFVKDLIYVVTTYVAALVASIFGWIVLIILLLAILVTMATVDGIFQKDIREIVLENQDDLEMIVEDLRSYDVPRVYVNKENITTYTSFDRLPDGRYILGHEESVFSTSEETQRFMKKLKIKSIDFSLFDELQIVTFEFYDVKIKGAYWVDPDTPTEKAVITHHELTPSGDGWEYINSGNRYYTEKICDNWYYFVFEA